MEVRTQTVDIEKVLEDLWERFKADVSMSVELNKKREPDSLYNDTYEDGRAIKYCLDTLRWCKLIDEAECSDMQDKVDAYIDTVIEEFKNRITENKED